MMKRFAAVLIFLALALPGNAAIAAISLSIDGGGVGAEYTMDVGEAVSLGVYSDTTASVHAFLGIEDNGLWTYSNIWPGPNPPYTYYGYLEWEITVMSPTSPGTVFSLDFDAEGEGTVDIYLRDGEGYTVDTLTVNIVPEPMTLVLLGAGGLALLRRRRV